MSVTNVHDQLTLEREIGKELAKKIEVLKTEKEEESEKYKILLTAFEELYLAHQELLKKQDVLINSDLSLEPDHKNELLAEYDTQSEQMKQIRHRSGIDLALAIKHRGRRTSSLEGYITGASLLRTIGGTNSQRNSGRLTRGSIDEGPSRAVHRLSSPPILETNDQTSLLPMKMEATRTPSHDQPKRRRSLFQGIQKSIPLLNHVPHDEPNSEHEDLNHSQSSVSSFPLSHGLSSVFSGLHRASVTGFISHEVLPVPAVVVPLFEHFLVIGVSVDAALSVSDQLIQKQTKLTQRLMNKLSGFFRTTPQPTNTRTRSVSQLTSSPTPQTGHESPSESSSSTSTGLFSRMISREDSADFTSRSSMDSRPQSTRWTSSFFSRSASAMGIEVPHKEIVSSTDSEQSPQKPSPPQPSNSTASSPSTVTTTLGQGSKNENATFTEPEILFRYPDDIDPPPPEVCDFCMPSGGKLKHLQPNDAETSIFEIMYGHGQNQRNARCFIFILEDKTLDIKEKIEDTEAGINTGRTYGICVVHPRLLNPKYPNGYTKEEYLEQENLPQTDPSQPPVSFEFEASVCYCFITRFPLFEFFFHVIFNIITYERMVRMEKLDTTTTMSDKHVYEYVPISVYHQVLDKLAAIPPPKYNTTLNFAFSPSVTPINFKRAIPSISSPEHLLRAAEWALPPLIRWLNPKIIVWALGLMMCEVKLVIIGVDPATVSCAVIGLSSLLKPLQWVSPMIPIMPLKHIEFLESPVPLIAGMVIDGDHASPQLLDGEAITPLSILKLCNDGESVTAVLDLSARDIFVLSNYVDVVPELIFPHAEDLIQDMQTALYCHTSPDLLTSSELSGISGSVRRENKPNYNVTVDDVTACKAIQELVFNHLTMVGQKGKEVASELLKEQMEAVEQRVKANLERIQKFKNSAPQPQSTLAASPSLTSLCEKGEDEEENEPENCTTDTDLTRTETAIPFVSPPIDNSPSAGGQDSVLSPSLSSNQSPTINRSVSLPIPTTSGITFIGGGNVIPIVSLQNMFIDTTETTKLFLRRFVTTQMFTEYDDDLSYILQDMNHLGFTTPNSSISPDHDHVDDSMIYSRLPGISSSAVATSRKSSLTISCGSVKNSNRSRSLYLTPGDYDVNKYR